MSNDETSSQYYTGIEMLTILNSLKSSAKLLRRATKRSTTLEDMTSHAETSRGIEHLASRDTLLRLQIEKERNIRIALVAQNDGASPQHIANVTSIATRDAVDRAIQRGKQDEASKTR